jgi:hypothetical protein
MRQRLEIENIEELRLHAGIDNVELREAVAQLRVGDRVRLTFLAGPEGVARETLLVQVTRIRKTDFRWWLRMASEPTQRPGSRGKWVTQNTQSLHHGGGSYSEPPPDFLGRLTSRPTRGGLSGLRVGARVAFAAGQVHSIAAPQQRSQGEEE